MSDICQSPYKLWHGTDLCFILWKTHMKAVHCLVFIWSINWDLNSKLCFMFLYFWEGFLLCSPGWPRIPNIDQTGLECVEILLSLPLYRWDCSMSSWWHQTVLPFLPGLNWRRSIIHYHCDVVWGLYSWLCCWWYWFCFWQQGLTLLPRLSSHSLWCACLSSWGLGL